ncbi:MAG TPA: hypothetical protein VI434_01245 [Candidatus Dormibacteraeota bacterium]
MLLTVSCILVGLQTTAVLYFATVGLTLSTSQRVALDLISGAAEGGVPSLSVAIVCALVGLVMAGMLLLLVRGSRLARWVIVALEVVTLIGGLPLIQVAVLEGFFDPFNLGFTAGTVFAPAVILFALVAHRAVRRYFRSVRVPAAPIL